MSSLNYASLRHNYCGVRQYPNSFSLASYSASAWSCTHLTSFCSTCPIGGVRYEIHIYYVRSHRSMKKHVFIYHTHVVCFTSLTDGRPTLLSLCVPPHERLRTHPSLEQQWLLFLSRMRIKLTMCLWLQRTVGVVIIIRHQLRLSGGVSVHIRSM